MLDARLGGAAALAVLGLCVAARAADDGTAAANDSHWWDKLVPVAFRKSEPPPAPGSKPRFGQETAPAAPPTPAAPVAKAIPRESDDEALFRRLAVCDRLKQVAIDTDNPDLERQVTLLEQRVYQVYNLHKTAPARDTANEAALDQTVGATGRGTFTPTATTRTTGMREDRE